MNNIDVNGDSLEVLNYGNDLIHHHMTMLIQNEVGKWQYFSINGNNVYISEIFTGGRKFNDLGVGEFNNPQEFMNSSYNTNGDEDDSSINHFGFPEGYMLPTNKEQDNIIRKTFVGIAQNEEYDFLEVTLCLLILGLIISCNVRKKVAINEDTDMQLNSILREYPNYPNFVYDSTYKRQYLDDSTFTFVLDNREGEECTAKTAFKIAENIFV